MRMQIVAEGEDIVYTYDVYWEEVSQPWSGRWGLYIGDATLTRLVAMLNPLAMLVAVCVLLALLCRRVAGRDLAPPETTPLPAKVRLRSWCVKSREDARTYCRRHAAGRGSSGRVAAEFGQISSVVK